MRRLLALHPFADCSPEEAVARQRALRLGVCLVNVIFYFGNILSLDVGFRWQWWLLALQLCWVGLALTLVGRERLGVGLQLAVLAVEVVLSTPGAPNHLWLQIYVSALLVLWAPTARDAPFSIAALRWLCWIVFTWSGVQKVLHGAWWNGAFFGWMLATTHKMNWLLEPLVSADELARVRDLVDGNPAQGSFALDAWPLRLVAWSIVAAEILLPLMLLVKRTRPVAAWGGIFVFVGIIVASREITFGALMAGLLLLFVPARFAPAYVAVVGAMLIAYSAVRAFLPTWVFN